MAFVFLFLTNCTEDLEETPSFQGHLFGFVTSSGGSLQGVLVTVRSGNVEHEATTNAFGRYQIKNLEGGEYTVSFSKANYIGRSEKINLQGSIENEKSVSLEAGDLEISVSDDGINASVVSGEIKLSVESNAIWTATTVGTWLSLEEESKIGTGTIRVLWDSNEDGLENRTAQIKILAGNVEKVIKVFQARPTRILSVRGVVGEILSESKSRIQIQFDGGVTIKRIIPIFANCVGEVSQASYNDNRDLVSFVYGCGRLGFSYPFHIEWEDQYGNLYIGEFRADFFSKSLQFNGMIVSRFNVPGENTQWILTQSPDKIYKIDLSTLTILKEYSWTPSSHFESFITLNPYNQLLYVGGAYEIAVVDPNSGMVREKVSLPTVPYRPESGYRVVDMAFKNDGMGVFVCYEVDTGGSAWFMIDSSDKNRIFFHPQNGWDEDKYHHVESLKVSLDQNSLYLYASGFNTYGLMKLGNNGTSLSSVQAFEGKPSLNKVIYNRIEDIIVFVHQSDISALVGNNLFDWGHRANILSADFAYHGDSDSHLYGIEEYGNLFLFDFTKGEIVKRFPSSGGVWRNIVVTLDGEYLIAETDYVDSNAPGNIIISNLVQFPTTLFR